MGRRRKGKTVKKNRVLNGEEDSEVVNAPHSFVIHRGKKVGQSIQDLTADFRKVMEPFTASDIKNRPKNVIKDFVHVAGLLKVSHLVMFTKTEKSPYIKIGRFPRGPTMTFKIKDYVLARDVRSSLKRQITYERQYAEHALLILNNFGTETLPEAEPGTNPLGSRELELTASMFQNLFPSINVTKVKLNAIRRCVLINFNIKDGTADFRHYTIKIIPVGVSKGVKKIVAQGKIPNLSKYDDVADYLDGGGGASDSEAEPDESSKVHLPSETKVSSRGNLPGGQSSIKLVELGPRMTLEPIKIEEGLLDGDVMYHKLVSKTPEEKEAVRAARKKRQKEKEKRRKEQEMNVKTKEKNKNDHKLKSLAGMKKKKDLPEGFKSAPDSSEEEDDDDDAEWYKKEVGSNPEPELFESKSSNPRKRKGSGLPFKTAKKFRKTPAQPLRRDKKKQRRPTDVYNSQGVGPEFDKKRPRNLSSFRNKKK